MLTHPLFREMYEETRNFFDSVTGKYDVSETKTVIEDGKPKDGYFPLTLGGAEISALMSLDEVPDFLSSMGSHPDAIDFAYKNLAQHLAASLDIPLPDDFTWQQFEEKYLVLPEEKRESVESEYCKLTFGFCLNDMKEYPKDPFYCYVAINYDSPYFRDSSEIKRNAGNPKLDWLLGECSSDIPQSLTDFKSDMMIAIRHAFPEYTFAETPKP